MADEKKVAGASAINHGNSEVDSSLGDVEGAPHEDFGWNRGLTTRSVIMLSLGGGIGLGLWIGTGTALAAGKLS